jgi:hypothetical protein
MGESKLAQLRLLRERGQGGVRPEKKRRVATDRNAKAVTKAMLEAASAIPAKPRKKPKRSK